MEPSSVCTYFMSSTISEALPSASSKSDDGRARLVELCSQFFVANPLETPTIVVRSADLYPDTVLFLDAIPEDLVTGATHNLISVDPLPLGNLKAHPVHGL
jgi:hypothetical protein